MNVAETARQALAFGFTPVLVRNGTKQAHHKDWQVRSPYTNETITEFDWEHAGVGLQWGKGFSDVDLETPLVSRAADILLPQTPMIWGRPGNLRSHRVYAVPEIGVKGIKLRGPAKTPLVELRGDKQQSVIPPSLWYDKSIDAPHGTYEWWDNAGPLADVSDGTAPAAIPEIPVAELEVQVRETAFAALMAELWPALEGNRHDAMIGICGMLLKGGRDVDRVSLICRAIVELGNDPDPGDRTQIPRSTNARIAAGEEVAGYTMVEAALGAEIAKWVAGMFHLPADKITSIGGIALTDQGNAELFSTLWSDDLMYLPLKHDWVGWTSVLWDLEPGMLMEQDKAMLTVKHMEALAPTLGTATERAAMRAHAAKSGSAAAISAMARLARSKMRHSEKQFDTNPYLFNTPTGTLNLETGELQPHERSDFITKVAGTPYVEDAECPQWLQYLQITFEGNQALIDFVQRMAGYMMTGDVGEECVFFLYGMGANGKTTFIETLTAIWGAYGLRSPVETVMKKRGDPGIPNDVARLRGARLVVTQEIGADMRFSENILKDLSGNDTKTARFLHGEWFDFKPELKLVLYGNHKPTIVGTDQGIWRRIKLIPFVHDMEKDERRVKNLSRVLIREEGPGILRWCLQGCRSWQLIGLSQPEAVTEATASYREEMDVFGEFFREYFEVSTNEKTIMRDVFAAYRAWCSEMNEREMTQRKLNQKLIEMGMEKYRSHGDWWMRGMRMVKQAANL
jgi:putative DNA primase/helicase